MTAVKGKVQEKGTDWKASWIWGGSEESPRNEWRCFRTTFDVPAEGWSAARFSITADSRYVLFINGTRVGRGPVRSWPQELAYDSYDVRPWLRKGQTNTAAVLVMHFGISTFSYIRGRGGLLAQLDWSVQGSEGAGEESGSLITDGNWRTSIHAGHNPRAPRLSLQQAFTEWVDAAQWDEDWTTAEYEEGAAWEQAAVIGPAGMQPWPTLKPRDIPHLTEETIYPVRVEAMSRVTPLEWTVYLDARSIMDPASEKHGNSIMYAGYIATQLRMSGDSKITLGFAYTAPVLQALWIDGSRYPKSQWRGIGQDRYLDVELTAGGHLVLFELAGYDHGRGLFVGIDSAVPFEVVSPLAGEAGRHTAFAAIGPFECFEYIDHQTTPEQERQKKTVQACADFSGQTPDLDPAGMERYEQFRETGKAKSVEELHARGSLLRAASPLHVCPESVYTLTLWKKKQVPLSVPAQMQQMVTANSAAAEIPVYEAQDTELIIDFGKEWSGYVEFELEAAAGTVIDLFCVEYIRDGNVHYTHYLDNSLRYICREGKQRFASNVRRGFRYGIMTVRNAGRPVQMYEITVRQSNFPLAEVGQFQCSDAVLNDIWEMSRHTTRLCMEDTFVDCPAYEQTFWVGDSRNEALIGYYLFGAEPLVKRCLDLVPGSAFQTPLYADQVPSGWNSVIPNWTFFWAEACCEYVHRTGDTGYARSIWPHVRYTLEHYLERLDERGLLAMKAWNFLDWAPMDQPRSGVVSHQNMFLVKALRSAALLAELAGQAEEGDGFLDHAERLKQAIGQHLWSEERKAYLDCIHEDGRRSDIFSMQTQVAAYLCGIADGGRKQQLEAYLASPPESFVQIGSPFMSFFYYEALVQKGDVERLVDDIRKQYGSLLRYGATTCWETYPSTSDVNPYPNQLTRSHCHAWSAAPGYFLGSQVLGVAGSGLGWTDVVVQPKPCGMEWARGSVPLPHEGRIDVAWTVRQDGTMLLQAWAPAGVNVTLRLPEGMDGETELVRLG
ncbi:family 78 glycoside hydrolase catalytic domain [Paenibacillus senegalensis]|uniref:family 78 glycoside hydrolase catalytic domain n=1 Tax=Paenibacillus senegalensis TaxID=1465766 RepID=UPI000287D730|nr:family 78 glycoside hydrolase catalytic domain [Paenibacillus senegalensis]